VTPAPPTPRPVISGIATSPRGPIPTARVTIESSPRPLPDIAALTDDRGRFTLATAGAGRYTIAVHADGFKVARIECDVDTSDKHVDVELIPNDVT
jgi:Carboxypeptidase regulatory-like domain